VPKRTDSTETALSYVDIWPAAATAGQSLCVMVRRPLYLIPMLTSRRGEG
jgi:hypothetical protein